MAESQCKSRSVCLSSAFNISHFVSKRQSFPESLYLGKARLPVDIFLTFPAGDSQSLCLLLVRRWLVGWNLLLGCISGSQAHFAFNAQNWDLSPIAERVEVGVGLIRASFCFLGVSVSAPVCGLIPTIKCLENPSTPGQSRGTRRPVSLLLHATSRVF